MTIIVSSGRLRMLFLATSAAAVALLPVSCRSRQATAGSGQPPAKVGVTTAVRRTLESTIEMSGSVHPEVSAGVLTPVEGRITNMSAREGDRVGAGRVLATVSPFVRDEIVNAARLELERRRRAGEDTLAARQQLDFALGAYQAAPVVSAIDGIVARRLADPGDMVSARQMLYEIQSADSFHVEVQVSELHLSTCRVGTAVQVWLDALPERPLEGVVRRINPVVAEQTRTSAAARNSSRHVRASRTTPRPGRGCGRYTGTDAAYRAGRLVIHLRVRRRHGQPPSRNGRN